MRAAITIPLSVLFVALAGFNVWSMLARHDGSKLAVRSWTALHRAAGYAFVTLFAIFLYFMLLRLKGSPDEVSPRIALHMTLAFALGALLIVKICVVRAQEASYHLLSALGITIFVVAFTLVAFNVAVHLFRAAPAERVPSYISWIVVATAALCAGVAFAATSKRRDRHPNILNAPSARQSGELCAENPDRLTLTLARIERQSHDAKVLRFLLPKGLLFHARPGQFLTFEWFLDGKTVHRSYSICSSPTQSAYVEIMPKRKPDGYVSQFLNDRATPGLMVKARGPYGSFYFDEDKHERIVLIAGGSGITPMISMVRYIRDLCIPIKCTLIYCARSEGDLVFHAELSAAVEQMNGFHYVLVVSKASSGWVRWKGRLRREILQAEVEKPLESTYFLCGPTGLMELGRTLLQELSVQSSQILQESFGDQVANTQHETSDARFVNVTFARRALTVSTSRGRTLLETAEANGISVPFGCRQGNCGTCMTRLLRGNVDMPEAPALDDKQRSHGLVLPCVCRPLGDVTLDT